jgi:hypothetical protein
MRYELNAIISARGVLEPLRARYRSAHLVALPRSELALIPLTEQLVWELDETGTRVCAETGFSHLSTGAFELLRATSAHGRIAYLEADYFGRDGRQSAAVWHLGEIIDGPRLLGRNEPFPAKGKSPICAALRQLGVVASGHRDEFVVAGLGRFRSTSEWAAAGAAREA